VKLLRDSQGNNPGDPITQRMLQQKGIRKNLISKSSFLLIEPQKVLRNLEYMEPAMVDRTPTALIDSTDVEKEVEFWANAVVRYVVDYTPRMNVIYAFISTRLLN